MSVINYPATGFAHLYRSLLRFAHIEPAEARKLVYLLNTANIDANRYERPGRPVHEMSEALFFKYLDNTYARPYRTEVQLFKSLEALCDAIRWSAITDEQRDAVHRLYTIMDTLGWHFHKAFGVDIDDSLTVYSQCRRHLVPDASEPCVCLKGLMMQEAS